MLEERLKTVGSSACNSFSQMAVGLYDVTGYPLLALPSDSLNHLCCCRKTSYMVWLLLFFMFSSSFPVARLSAHSAHYLQSAFFHPDAPSTGNPGSPGTLPSPQSVKLRMSN